MGSWKEMTPAEVVAQDAREKCTVCGGYVSANGLFHPDRTRTHKKCSKKAVR
jgi:hypothetical protein